MKFPNLLSFRPVKRLARRVRSGFALIITLSLMTLLLLLVLTLALLVQLELTTAQGNLNTAEARQNALLAAYVAIGQLQKFAGPDQRITTTADIGRGIQGTGDTSDPSTMPILSGAGGQKFPVVNTKDEGAVSPTPIPYGSAKDFKQGGTLYWTEVWGSGSTPLALYTGVEPNATLRAQNGSDIAPMPILLNYLISGDESTALNTYPNGVVKPPVTASPIRFTADTGNPASGIRSTVGVDPLLWTSLTTGLVITPTAGSNLTDTPAVLMVGPATAGTNLSTQSATPIQPITIYPGNQAAYASARTFVWDDNLIVAPLVNIDVPSEGNSNLTTGRYAWWVGDEGVKAKYNIVDPYAGTTDATQLGAAGQPAKYRLRSPQRTGIERMYGMASYATDVSEPNSYGNGSEAHTLLRMFDSSQILLVDKNMVGLKEGDSSRPNQTMQMHYFDFTPYSYGVLSDALRGGLRYDLTVALEPNDNALFSDATNGLKGKAILPPTTSSTNTGTSPTTEAGLALSGLTLTNRGDLSGRNTWHGPAAPNSNTIALTSQPAGILWDVLQSYYALAGNNTPNTRNGAVVMQAASSNTTGVSPVILQARLKISEYVDQQQYQYVAIEPIFVIANPYNFPITPPAGGLDLGYRINSNTGWEWGFHAIARNSDRNSPHGSGVGMYIGYDLTQGNISATSSGTNHVNSTAFDKNPPNLTSGYSGAYFYSATAQSPATPTSSSWQGGTGILPGYYPILKNPESYSNFIAPLPSSAGTPGNSLYQSALDQVAFHIPATLLPSTTPLIWQPGEAKTFILADETSGGRNLTGANGSLLQPLNTKYNQLTGTTRKIVAVVGTPDTTNGGYYISAKSIVPVLLQPKTIAQNAHFFMLRYTGIKTSGDKATLYVGNSTTATFNLNLAGNNDTNTNDYANNLYTWPSPEYGYISTGWPSIAATLELRFDTTPTGSFFNGTGGANLTTPRVDGSDFGTYPVNITVPTQTSGSVSGIAGPGQNVLQSITNFDLTGAGLPNHTYPDPASFIDPTPISGYRRQYLGSNGPHGSNIPLTTTDPTPNSSTPQGTMPIFLESYVMAMALPGPMDPMFYAKDPGENGGTDSGNLSFDPNKQVSYRTYADFNLRAKNLALPPTSAFNSLTAVETSTNTINYSVVTNNTPALVTTPPFGRIWNQGPNYQSDDDKIQATFAPNDDTSFNTKNLGPVFSTFQVTSNSTMDVPWGYSLSNAGATNSGGAAATLVQGDQYNILYGLPSRAANSPGTVPNPNPDASDPYTASAVPDVPLMSLGQLQHADVTGDDVWVSVGYQPGSAIGNSYYTPFVDRNSSMETKNNQSGKYLGVYSGSSGPNQTTSNFRYPWSSNTTLGVYDISYLMNVALFDHYFFSTLTVASNSTILPANARLKYAAGIIPTTAQLGIGAGASPVKDPVTNLPMFPAYAPARYLMIDGAFNINSTSVEAWKAVLSAMRSVAYSQNFKGTDPKTNTPVTYFPRSIASPSLVNETVTNTGGTNMTSSFVNQPLSMGPGLNMNPSPSDSYGTDAASYAGFRELSDVDIDMLAQKIVQQVRLRGPFLSLAQFVNRRLTHPPPGNNNRPAGQGYLDPLSWSGALQTAIDINTGGAISNSLNNFYLALTNGTTNPTSPEAVNITYLPADSNNSTMNVNQTYPQGDTPFITLPYPTKSADPNSRLVGIPGWLTQADLLEALAPILAVRSDTFIIRTYGEVISPLANQQDLANSITQDPTLVLSRAWCELVVQRVPDYIATDAASLNDPSTVPSDITHQQGYNGYNPAATLSSKPYLSPENAAFGRRFKVVSLRWLTANDI